MVGGNKISFALEMSREHKVEYQAAFLPEAALSNRNIMRTTRMLFKSSNNHIYN